MDVMSMTTKEFNDTIAKDACYLRIELSHGAFNERIEDVKNVVGFIEGKAVVITDLDERQEAYYESQKKVN